MAWTVIFLDDVVEAEMENQPEDIQARLKRMVLLIGEFGLRRLPAKYVSHLEGRLWELRMKGKDGIARALMSPPADSVSSLCGSSRRRRRRRRAARSSWP